MDYREGSKIKGYVYNDVVWMGRGDRNKNYSVRFNFGCHISESKMFKMQYADGIMGLTKNPNTLPYKLAYDRVTSSSLFSLCLSRTGGQINVGGTNESTLASEFVSTSLNSGSQFYVVNVREVSIAQEDGSWEPLNVDIEKFNRGQGTIVDSGTTFTYVPGEVATQFAQTAESKCNSAGQNCGSTFYSKEVGGERTLCIDIPSGRSKGDFDSQQPPEYLDGILPTLQMAFAGASMTIPPSQYLFSYYSAKSSGWGKTWCIGIFGFQNSGAILGANVMQGYVFQFDGNNDKLSFSLGHCDKLNSCKRCDAFLNNHSSGNEYLQRLITLWSEHALAIIGILAGIMLVSVGIVYWKRRRRNALAHQRLEEDEPVAVQNDDAQESQPQSS